MICKHIFLKTFLNEDEFTFSNSKVFLSNMNNSIYHLFAHT